MEQEQVAHYHQLLDLVQDSAQQFHKEVTLAQLEQLVETLLQQEAIPEPLEAILAQAHPHTDTEATPADTLPSEELEETIDFVKFINK